MMNDRAQSQVLGAALVFGFLVLLLGIYQVFGVPQQNEEIEFKHNQKVQGELQDLRGAVMAAAEGVDGSETIKLGTQYPTRFLALNPPAPTGSLRTHGTDDPTIEIVIQNAVATNPETADFWDGSTSQDFATGSLRYSPAYTRYDEAPETAIDNSVVYNEFDDGTVLASSGQALVDGREISLVALDGDLSTTKTGTVTVETEPLSASTTSIPIENQGGPVTVEIATKVPEETWVDTLLADEIDDDGGAPSGTTCDSIEDAGDSGNDRFIKNCEYDSAPSGPFNTLTLEFEDGGVYDLSLSKVGVGTGASGTSAQYITVAQGDGTSVPQDGRQKIVFDVRDAFNNPPTNSETVKVAIEDQDAGDLVFEGTTHDNEVSNIKVGDDGKVELFYEAPATTSTSPKAITINATFENGYAANPETAADTASIDLRVINASKINRTNPLINPPNGVKITGAACTGPPTEDSVEITFESDSPKTITEMRYAFYSPDSAGVAAFSDYAFMVMTSPESQTFELTGDYEDTDISVDSGGQVVTVHFEDDSGNTANVTPGDFVVTEILVQDVRRTFFFAPTGCSGGPGS